MIRIGLLLFVVFAAFDSFYLLPWARIPGVFNFSDLGLLAIGGALVVHVGLSPSERVREAFRQPEVVLALVYLVIVLMQVSLAGLNYRQSVVNGVVASSLESSGSSMVKHLLDVGQAVGGQAGAQVARSFTYAVGSLVTGGDAQQTKAVS